MEFPRSTGEGDLLGGGGTPTAQEDNVKAASDFFGELIGKLFLVGLDNSLEELFSH